MSTEESESAEARGNEGATLEEVAQSIGMHVQKSPKSLPKLDIEAANEKLDISAKFEQIAKSKGIKLENPKTSKQFSANLNHNIDKPDDGQSKDMPLLTPEEKIANDKLNLKTSVGSGDIKETKRSKVSEQLLNSYQNSNNSNAASDKSKTLDANANKVSTSESSEGSIGLKSAIAELKSLAGTERDVLVKTAHEVIIKVRNKLLLILNGGGVLMVYMRYAQTILP